MWPFAPKSVSRLPRVVIDGVSVVVDADDREFSFERRGVLYTFNGDVFDAGNLGRLDEVERWIAANDAEIRAVVGEHLKGWIEWDGFLPAPLVDITDLGPNNHITCDYSNPHDGGEDAPPHKGRPSVSWGDLGVNVEIVAGRVTDHSAGD